LRHQRHPIHLNHIHRRFRIQRVQIDRLALLQTHHQRLAILRDQTALVVVVEEGVQSGAVVEDVSAVEEAEAEGLVAGRLVALAEGWVGVLWVDFPG